MKPTAIKRGNNQAHTAALRRGITLLELLIVLAIVGVMVFIALPTLKPTEEEATIMSAKNQLQHLFAVEKLYFEAHGKYAPFCDIAKDPELSTKLDQRYHTEKPTDEPTVDKIIFIGPSSQGPILSITATLPDGTRYLIDDKGEIKPLQ